MVLNANELPAPTNVNLVDDDPIKQLSSEIGKGVTSILNSGIYELNHIDVNKDAIHELGQKLSILLDELPVDKFIEIGTESAGKLATEGINAGLNALGVVPGFGEVLEFIRLASNVVKTGEDFLNTGVQLTGETADTYKKYEAKLNEAKDALTKVTGPLNAQAVMANANAVIKDPTKLVDTASKTATAARGAIVNNLVPADQKKKVAAALYAAQSSVDNPATRSAARYGINNIKGAGKQKSMKGGLKKIKHYTRHRRIIGGRVHASIREFKTRRKITKR